MWLETEIRHAFAESIVEYLDVGAVLKGSFMHTTPIRNVHFGETGTTIESPPSNLLHRFWDDDSRETGATTESIFPNLRH